MTKKEFQISVKDDLSLYALLNKAEIEIISNYTVNQINNYSVKKGLNMYSSYYIYKKMFKIGNGQYLLWIVSDGSSDARIKLTSKYVYERKLMLFIVLCVYSIFLYFVYEEFIKYNFSTFSFLSSLIFILPMLYVLKVHYSTLKVYKEKEEELLKGIEKIILTNAKEKLD
jgi:hypothetical protein